MDKPYGHITAKYTVTCYQCYGYLFVENVADYISPRFETDWVAEIKKKGWKLTKHGWKCPICKNQLGMDLREPSSLPLEGQPQTSQSHQTIE